MLGANFIRVIVQYNEDVTLQRLAYISCSSPIEEQHISNVKNFAHFILLSISQTCGQLHRYNSSICDYLSSQHICLLSTHSRYAALWSLRSGILCWISTLPQRSYTLSVPRTFVPAHFVRLTFELVDHTVALHVTKIKSLPFGIDLPFQITC